MILEEVMSNERMEVIMEYILVIGMKDTEIIEEDLIRFIKKIILNMIMVILLNLVLISSMRKLNTSLLIKHRIKIKNQEMKGIDCKILIQEMNLNKKDVMRNNLKHDQGQDQDMIGRIIKKIKMMKEIDIKLKVEEKRMKKTTGYLMKEENTMKRKRRRIMKKKERGHQRRKEIKRKT